METIERPVLVLNRDYQPINICRVRRAIKLILYGKAETLINGRGEIHSISYSLPIPSVIHLFSPVRRPPFRRRLTKLEVFNRDKYTCQYCGKETRQLTLDHIIPRYRGGTHTWENIVSCCPYCNRRKAGRTPDEAGMRLICSPASPKLESFYIPHHYLRFCDEWQQFLGSSFNS